MRNNHGDQSTSSRASAWRRCNHRNLDGCPLREFRGSPAADARSRPFRGWTRTNGRPGRPLRRVARDRSQMAYRSEPARASPHHRAGKGLRRQLRMAGHWPRANPPGCSGKICRLSTPHRQREPPARCLPQPARAQAPATGGFPLLSLNVSLNDKRCQGQFERPGGRPTGRTAANRPALASTHDRNQSGPNLGQSALFDARTPRRRFNFLRPGFPRFPVFVCPRCCRGWRGQWCCASLGQSRICAPSIIFMAERRR